MWVDEEVAPITLSDYDCLPRFRVSDGHQLRSNPDPTMSFPNDNKVAVYQNIYKSKLNKKLYKIFAFIFVSVDKAYVLKP